MARAYDEEDPPLSERGIEQRNHALLRRYREFRRGADAVTAAWRAHPEVFAVSLIGSVARAPWKEVSRFGPYRRARVALWHECKDVDLALWLEHLDSLDGLRRAKARALRTLWDEASIGIASHQVDVFILEPSTDRYLGRLCDFNTCPKGKAEWGHRKVCSQNYSDMAQTARTCIYGHLEERNANDPAVSQLAMGGNVPGRGHEPRDLVTRCPSYPPHPHSTVFRAGHHPRD